MHQALRIEVWVVVVDLTEKLLDANVLLLLNSSLHIGSILLKVDF